MLHLWSLGVEGQFYLAFPIVLWGLYKLPRVPLWVSLSLLMLVSLALAIWIMERDINAAFYLLPFRAWELLLGAVVAAYPKLLLDKVWERELAAGASLLLILSAMWAYSFETPFPGLAAMVPCLGAALFLVATGSGPTMAGRALSWRPFVFIGLISYSLYLWHWPLLKIAEYFQPLGLSWVEKGALLAATLLLSTLSWKFIEQPFHKHGAQARPRTFLLTMVSLTILIASALGAYFYQNHKQKEFLGVAASTGSIPFEKNPYFHQCYLEDDQFKDEQVCQTNPDSGVKPSFVVWGDSYANTSAPLFFELSKEHAKNGYVFFRSNCPPITGLILKGSSEAENCPAYNARVTDFIARHKIKTVFLVANWSNWFAFTDYGLYYEDESWITGVYAADNNIAVAGTRRTIDRLLEQGVTPYFVINQPDMPFDVPHYMAIQEKLGKSEERLKIPVKAYKKQRAAHVMPLVESFRGTNVVVVDPLPLLCPDGYCSASLNGKPLYMDQGHFSLQGAQFEKPLFAPYFQSGKF